MPNAWQRGVTLIELLVSIVILAILMSLGMPSFQTMIQNASIRTATEAIQDGLQLARAEAIKRNNRVRFALGANSAWTVSVDSTAAEIQSRGAGEGSTGVVIARTPATASTVTFNSFGRVVENADASPALGKVLAHISATTRDLQIEIDPGGQVRMCDPLITAAGDPRRCYQ